MLRDLGSPDLAMTLHQEVEHIYREIGVKDGIARSLGSQALILQDRDDWERALALHQEEELIWRELGDPSGLALSLGNQAKILAMGMNRPKEALPLIEEAYGLAIDHGQMKLAEATKPTLERIRSKARQASVPVYVSTPHPGADPNLAVQRNMQYQQKLAQWNALPWWKRLKVKKPEPAERNLICTYSATSGKSRIVMTSSVICRAARNAGALHPGSVWKAAIFGIIVSWTGRFRIRTAEAETRPASAALRFKLRPRQRSSQTPPTSASWASGLLPSKRLVRTRQSSPHVRDRTVIVSEPFLWLLEMAADDVDEWLH